VKLKMNLEKSIDAMAEARANLKAGSNDIDVVLSSEALLQPPL
jgi:hypothetical protein